MLIFSWPQSLAPLLAIAGKRKVYLSLAVAIVYSWHVK
jgi:hypothetical protein